MDPRTCISPGLCSPKSIHNCEGTKHPLCSQGTLDSASHKANADNCPHTENCLEEALSWEHEACKHAVLAACNPAHCDRLSAAGKAKEFAADIFRRARAATGTLEPLGSVDMRKEDALQRKLAEDCLHIPNLQGSETSETLPSASGESKLPNQCSSCVADTCSYALSTKESHSVVLGCTCTTHGKPTLDNSASSDAQARTEGTSCFVQSDWSTTDDCSTQHQETVQIDPGYVNYIKLHYVLEPTGMVVDDEGK